MVHRIHSHDLDAVEVPRKTSLRHVVDVWVHCLSGLVLLRACLLRLLPLTEIVPRLFAILGIVDDAGNLIKRNCTHTSCSVERICEESEEQVRSHLELSLLDQHSLFACELSLVFGVVHERIDDRLNIIVCSHYVDAMTEHVVRLSGYGSLHERVLQPVHPSHSGNLVDGRLGELAVQRRVSNTLVAHVIQSQLQFSDTLLQQFIVAMLSECHIAVQLDSLAKTVKLSAAQPIGYLQERMILAHDHLDTSYTGEMMLGTSSSTSEAPVLRLASS